MTMLILSMGKRSLVEEPVNELLDSEKIQQDEQSENYQSIETGFLSFVE